MTWLSLDDPFSKLLLHFGVFLLKFGEFLVFEIRLLDEERLSLVELFDYERFLFYDGDVGKFLHFLFVDFELIHKLCFGDIFGEAFNQNSEIWGAGCLKIDFKFFDFLVVLEQGESDKPD